MGTLIRGSHKNFEVQTLDGRIDFSQIVPIGAAVEVLWPSYPSVLPCHLNVLVIAAKANITSPAIGEFE